MLTEQDIRLILDKVHPGFGYSDDPVIAALQLKLSIMLQAAVERKAQP